MISAGWLKSKHKILTLIFSTALALRLLYIGEIADNPFFTSPVVDAHTYTYQARAIAAGHWLDYTPDAFWQPPLYPWLAGTVYWLSGAHFYLVIRLVQACFGATSCVLLYLLGVSLFDRRIALGAACALTLYGPAIFFDAELLPASAALLLFLALVLAVLHATEKKAPWYWVIPGVLLGLAALNVATILITIPCLAVWIFVRAQGDAKQASLRLLALGAGLVFVIAPVTLRNYLIGGDFVFISWNAGVNFYVGTNPDYSATIQIRPGQAWLELVDRGRQAGFANGSENSAYFFSQAWEFIRSQPLDYGRLLAGKLAAFWNGDEIMRNQNIYYLRTHSHLLEATLWKNILAFPFGLVGPLAIVGFFLARNRSGPVRLLLVLSLSYMAGVVLFFVTARYRLVLVPFLLLFAAFAVSELTPNIRRLRLTGLLGAACVLVLAVWTNWSVGAMDMAGDAEHYYNLGHAYIEKNRFSEGIQALEKAAGMAAEDAEILVSLGTAYALTGNHRRAQDVLSNAARLYPERLDIRLNLGNAYFHNGLYRLAAVEYLAVLKAHPDDAMALRSAARALARSGQHEAAIVPYQQLQALEPTVIESYLALGYLYRQTGQLSAALIQFEHALELEPGHLTALLEVGGLYLQRQDLERALATLQQAAQHHPQNPQVHINLGEIFEAQQRWGKALGAYRKVLELVPDHGEIRVRLAGLVHKVVDGE